jgi:hypothetical protein
METDMKTIDWNAVGPVLAEALQEAAQHLDYCGYGDKWERECAYEAKLPQKIEAALQLVEVQDA